MRKRRRPDERDGTNRRSRGVWKTAVPHKRLQRDRGQSTMHRTISLRMTARSRRTDKARRAAIDQLVRDAAQRGIGSSSDLLLGQEVP
jgi:hypothetical protein